MWVRSVPGYPLSAGNRSDPSSSQYVVLCLLHSAAYDTFIPSHHPIVFHGTKSVIVGKPDLVEKIFSRRLPEHTIVNSVLQIKGFAVVEPLFFLRLYWPLAKHR